jgi:hypothetical protein
MGLGKELPDTYLFRYDPEWKVGLGEKGGLVLIGM